MNGKNPLTKHTLGDAGKPVFGTLISLLHNGVPVLGVIDQPITKERWIAVKGSGTTLNGQLLCTTFASTPP